MESYACAWAYAQERPNDDEKVPSLLKQIKEWEQVNAKRDKNINEKSLYVIWIGGNDYTRKLQRANNTIGAIGNSRNPFLLNFLLEESIERILALDPNAYFLLPSMPPAEKTPLVRNSVEKIRKLCEIMTDKHYHGLLQMAELISDRHKLKPNRIIVSEITTALRTLIEEQDIWGFDVNDLNPDHKIFIDNFHVSAPVHLFIANLLMKDLINAYDLSREVLKYDLNPLEQFHKYKAKSDYYLNLEK